mmetsp:Transcript_10436/g.21802  ORF Transcript_10436/g.21802 Transcript_10436/m.21802 type:complete len:181 (-) Transcript_10436:1321-1863(-)
MIDIVQPASMASNPIEQDEFSTHELNVTTLSLPESFDDVCTDLYKLESSASPLRKKNWTDLITPATKHTISTPKSDITPTNDGLEARIRELYAENLELKEKGRMYDAIKRRSLQSEAEIKSLQRQLEEKTSEYETSLMHENEYKHQTLEFKKKVQLLALDLDHAKKDAEQLKRMQRHQIK